MHDDRISAVEKELAKLRAEIADVRKAIKLESDHTTEDITKIWDWITHLAYKVLPQHAGTRSQVEKIFQPRKTPPEKSDDT
jgi:hypothetical protein